MKKRLCALALCLLLLATFPLTAFAEGESVPAPALTISTGRTGNELTVTVGIEHNPGIAGFDLTLHFNSDALTPTSAPVAEGWTHTATNYDAQFSGDTLKVVGVRKKNVTEDGALFTVSFTVKSSGSYALSVSGTACNEKAEALIELPTVYADDFGVKSVSCSGNSVTATVASYGNEYHGSAKAILTCYQGGKFVGCVMQDIVIAENSETNVTFTSVSLSGDTLRLLLVTPQFAPLCAAMDAAMDAA